MTVRVIATVAGVSCAVLVAGCGGSASSDSTSTAVTATSAAATTAQATQHAFEADHFAAGAIVGDVTTENCTVNSGAQRTCANFTVAGYPKTYKVGPFCPTTITTPAADAGIWFDGSGVYDLDGPFFKNLATLY